MSYDISLCGADGLPVTVGRFEDGGTYPLGGTTSAELNVTYNYTEHFAFGQLNGLRAGETISALEGAVARLGTELDSDYWKPTPGNAGAACARLLEWARQYPNGVWEVE